MKFRIWRPDRGETRETAREIHGIDAKWCAETQAAIDKCREPELYVLEAASEYSWPEKSVFNVRHVPQHYEAQEVQCQPHRRWCGR
jgi:hypothetical protein